jgi:hypothetical protein
LIINRDEGMNVIRRENIGTDPCTAPRSLLDKSKKTFVAKAFARMWWRLCVQAVMKYLGTRG